MSDTIGETAANTKSALKWENAPFVPEQTQRARKDTVSIPAKRLQSFLDEAKVEVPTNKVWRDLAVRPIGAESANHSSNRNFVASEGTHTEWEQAEGTLTKLVAFLVSFDALSSGEAFALREGRWVVSSVPLGIPGLTLLINDKSVSAVHATLAVNADGQIKIQDHFSEGGTGIVRGPNAVEEAVKDAVQLVTHGDLLRFGTRSFRLCVIPK